MRRVAAPLLLVLGACSSAGTISETERARALAELRAADQAYAAAVATGGLGAWVEAYAADGMRVDIFGEIAQGHAAIRAADAALFANDTARLVWEPEHAAVFDDGQQGVTRGTWRYDVDGAWSVTGAYLTLWRRGEDGRWQVALDTGAPHPPDDPHERWSLARATAWYDAQPWLVGCNYLPSTACNQLEAWQAATFDLVTIRRELGWAAELGLNAVRTHLHPAAYQQDPVGFLARLDAFLGAADAHGMQAVLVLFGDRGVDEVQPGPQPEPIPGVHDSRWLRSPGAKAALDPQAWPELERYVREVVARFGHDQRVLMWDVYDQPGHGDMGKRALPLLRAAFTWARAAGPRQPLTAGVWAGGVEFLELNEFQVGASDVVSFHNYEGAEALRAQIQGLKLRGRPLICTEWLRRGHSEVLDCLPVFARERVGAFHRGLVRGRGQWVYPWNSVEGAPVPERWIHDLLEADGTPHDPAEVAAFREWTARVRGAQ